MINKKVLIIIGTRPNFIKVTQFKRVAEKLEGVEIVIAHTGQHYDQNMSKVFFEQFKLTPDFFMNVGHDSVAKQMGEIIQKVDEIAEKVQPDMMIAVGDVNSTLCASIVANKRSIILGHLESGLRSRDREMPEEINRILTDEITDHFFVTEQSGIDNLQEEGKLADQIHFVGNTMIDTLVAFQDEITASPILENLGVSPKSYTLLTMHRPSNVDSKESLQKVVNLVKGMAATCAVVFPIHPRTIDRLKKFDLFDDFERIEGLVLQEPLGYFAFQKLIANAKVVVTDSGGIQEETTFKQVPCITIRDNTERPSTIDLGTNILHAFNVDEIVSKVNAGKFKAGKIPPLWDGKATERILKIIRKVLK